MSLYLQKFRHFQKAIKHNGGYLNSYLTIYRSEELKWGDFVGEDKYGNKYYHNPLYFFGKSRWVIYPDSVGMDYDGSQIPADWHRWLHYIGDKTPIEAPPTQHKWMIDHKENQTNLPGAYMPYSTPKPKIEAWQPK